MILQPSFRALPEGSLPGILEPFMWLSAVDNDVIKDLRTGIVIRSVRVDGIIKGPETAGDTGAGIGRLAGKDQQEVIDDLARATRESMYRAAEDAITAAREAGWPLAEHPRIEMDGRIRRDRETGVDVPCAECRVNLRFHVPDGRGPTA